MQNLCIILEASTDSAEQLLTVSGMSENDVVTLYLKSFFNSVKNVLENIVPEEVKSQIVHQNMSS